MTMRLAAIAAFLLTIMSGVAFADGIPTEWQMGFQEPASTSMERINEFHNLLLVLITVISLFVLGLMIYVAYRYNEKKNPVPSKTTHHTMIEIIWTVVPVIILVWLFIPSYNMMVENDRVVDADMTLKVIGHQWYWSYEYPDHGNFTFDAQLRLDFNARDDDGNLIWDPSDLLLDLQTLVEEDPEVRELALAEIALNGNLLPQGDVL